MIAVLYRDLCRTLSDHPPSRYTAFNMLRFDETCLPRTFRGGRIMRQWIKLLVVIPAIIVSAVSEWRWRAAMKT